MTGSEGAAKWVKNMLGNKESARRGAEGVKESPGKKAAERQDAYAAGCAEAASSGRFASACRAVTLEDWKSAYLDKGLKNLDVGVKAAESKMAKFLDKFLPYIQAKSKEIQGMAKGGRSEAMARIEANLDALESFKQMNSRG